MTPAHPPRSRPASPWVWLTRDPLISTERDLATADDVAVVQEFFADRLPASWTAWVTECGAPSGYGRALLGLGRRTTDVPANAPEDALDVLMLLRLTEPGFGTDLLPLEVLPDRQLHCLSVGPAGPGTVVLVDLDRPELRVRAASNLRNFLSQWQRDLHAIAMTVTEYFGRRDSTEADTLLRPDEWSTRRLCSQDVVVALLQTRHNRDTNEHDVAVCATATLSSFAEGAPARWAMTTILVESYQAGGSLAVNFVRRVRTDGQNGYHPFRIESRRQPVPLPFAEWARSRGIALDERSGRWDHETGERLLVAATRLPDSLRALLPSAGVAPAAVCAAVATQTWPALDAEAVLRRACAPVRVLTGAVLVTDRLRYLADQQVVRGAMMLSTLYRHLQRGDQPSASDDDDTVRSIEVDFGGARSVPGRDASAEPVAFTAVDGGPVTADWPVLAGPAPLADRRLVIRTLAVDADLLAVVGPAALRGCHLGEVLLVPADASARHRELTDFLTAADRAGICVLAAPEYTTTMDVAIAKRLDRARMTRQ